jgi:hypothetical protein
MTERPLSNSERHLQKLAEEEAEREEPKGIFELFDRDEDAPLARDDADD